MLALIRRHPIITVFTLVCIGVGVWGGFLLGPAEWPPWRKTLAGALCGAMVAFIIGLNRAMGAYAGSEDRFEDAGS